LTAAKYTSGYITLTGKEMGFFIDIDNMMGKDFASGIAKLKIVAER
jgi:hypothetical protein